MWKCLKRKTRLFSFQSSLLKRWKICMPWTLSKSLNLIIFNQVLNRRSFFLCYTTLRFRSSCSLFLCILSIGRSESLPQPGNESLQPIISTSLVDYFLAICLIVAKIYSLILLPQFSLYRIIVELSFLITSDPLMVELFEDPSFLMKLMLQRFNLIYN